VEIEKFAIENDLIIQIACKHLGRDAFRE
jgi:hypothetical protein